MLDDGHVETSGFIEETGVELVLESAAWEEAHIVGGTSSREIVYLERILLLEFFLVVVRLLKHNILYGADDVLRVGLDDETESIVVVDISEEIRQQTLQLGMEILFGFFNDDCWGRG